MNETRTFDLFTRCEFGLLLLWCRIGPMFLSEFGVDLKALGQFVIV